MEIINFFNPIAKSRWHNPKIKHYACIILCFTVTVACISMLFLTKFSEYICKAQERNSLQSQFEIKKISSSTVASLEKQYARTQEIINQLQNTTHTFSSILLHMGNIIPNQIKIAECIVEKDLKITGYAKKLSKLYSFLQALANHTSIEKVQLLKTIQEAHNQQNLIKFFCTITIKYPNQPGIKSN